MLPRAAKVALSVMAATVLAGPVALEPLLVLLDEHAATARTTATTTVMSPRPRIIPGQYRSETHFLPRTIPRNRGYGRTWTGLERRLSCLVRRGVEQSGSSSGS